MPVLVFSSRRRKNQKRPLSWTNDRTTYFNASRLIDAIMLHAKRHRVLIKSEGHTSLEGNVTRIRYKHY